MKRIILILIVIFAIVFLVVLYQHLTTTGMVTSHRIFARKPRYYVVGEVKVEQGKIIQFDREINRIS